MEITRDLLRTLRTDIDAALLAVAKKHGVMLTMGNASFTSDNATMKMSIVPASKEAVAAVASGASPKDVQAAADYKRLCTVYNLHPSWLNMTFQHGGSTLTVIGLLPNKRKNNVLVQGTGGGRYIMAPEELHRAFARV